MYVVITVNIPCTGLVRTPMTEEVVTHYSIKVTCLARYTLPYVVHMHVARLGTTQTWFLFNITGIALLLNHACRPGLTRDQLLTNDAFTREDITATCSTGTVYAKKKAQTCTIATPMTR